MAHGSVHSEDEYVYPDKPFDELRGQLSSSDFTILGHTHHPFLWCNGDRWLINPGSVGQPRDQSAMASFAYLDIANRTVLPRKVGFAVDNLIREIDAFDPGFAYIKKVLTR